jgi:TRAP-type C4-dicarboxylate transport system permease small subunit
VKGEPEAKPASKAESKGEAKPSSKDEPKAASKSEPKAEPKAETKSEPEAKPEPKAESKKAELTPAAAASRASKPELESDGAVGKALDIPPTRRHETAAEPPVRPSQSNLEIEAPLSFPDDGPLAARLRSIDTLIGKVEQVVLVALLAIVTLVAGTHALLDRIAHVRLEFKDDVIRGGTFTIALLGAAFATQQARNLSMDLVSRRLSPRTRLMLKVVLALFTIFVVVLFVNAGLTTVDIQKPSEQLISARHIAWMIPIGGVLIIVHTLVHTIIDIDYLVRGKTPPERMRSGH